MRVAFYKATRPGLKGLYNRFVRWWERGPYSHCELVFPDGMSASSSFEDGGVRFKHIEYDPAKWDFIEVPWADGGAARRWFEKHIGWGYDLRGNARFLFGPLPDGRDKVFCSDAVWEALCADTEWLWPAEGWRFGPNALAAVLRGFEKRGG